VALGLGQVYEHGGDHGALAAVVTEALEVLVHGSERGLVAALFRPAERAGAHPAGVNLGGALDPNVAAPGANNDRRAAQRRGPGVHVDAVHDLATAQGFDRLQVFVEQLEAVLEVLGTPNGLVTARAGPRTHADHETPFAQRLQRREALRELRRVAQRHLVDARPDLDTLGGSAGDEQPHQRIGACHCGQAIADPYAVQAGRLDHARSLHQSSVVQWFARVSIQQRHVYTKAHIGLLQE
jgi:hypothetical protein